MEWRDWELFCEVVEHGGFFYDSDAYNDELPYWVRVGDKPQLVIPYSLVTNDVKFGRGVFGPGEDFFAYLRDNFDLLYEEGAERPGGSGRKPGKGRLFAKSDRGSPCHRNFLERSSARCSQRSTSHTASSYEIAADSSWSSAAA